ncbi:MAG TPA: FAD-dependent oxidoreductase [Phycisphaerae bacterium]|nr:FAD-dependent oxidoreductase [Phycisphaerae bacterium]
MTVEQYPNLVIGCGIAGKLIAWNLAKMGQKTIVVERSMIGGACPNVACLPSKNMVYSAKAISLVDPKIGLGVTSGQFHVNMHGVIRRKREMVEGLIKVHLDAFKASGAELLMGEARFVDPKTVEVTLNAGGTRRLRGDRVFLDVGTRAAIPDIPGLAAAAPMTHVEILDREQLPEHLVILGGGYVGLEFAQAMRRFGSRVTVVQHGKQLLKQEDPDVADGVLELFKDEGIEVLLQSEVLGVSGRSGAGVELKLRVGANEQTLGASDILVAVGRTPNTDRLDPVKGNIRLDANGYIQVNEKLQTSVEGVWAMGECAGSPKFTHVGEDDFRIVLNNLTGGNRTTRGRLIPYCIFTDPEVAHVGMSESEAKAKNIPYRLAKIPMAMVLRMRTLSETRGFCKALVGADDHILGFTAFGAEASEMMAVVQTAILAGLPYTTLRDAIFTHPTAAEGLGGLFSSVPAKSG